MINLICCCCTCTAGGLAQVSCASQSDPNQCMQGIGGCCVCILCLLTIYYLYKYVVVVASPYSDKLDMRRDIREYWLSPPN